MAKLFVVRPLFVTGKLTTLFLKPCLPSPGYDCMKRLGNGLLFALVLLWALDEAF